MQKLFIETLGCAMNVRDTEHIIAELQKYKNYTTTTDIKEADLIIINTCSVREKPVQKLYAEIGQFNVDKKKGAKIGVCGCTASHLGHDLIKKAPYIDFVLGARNVSKISKVIDVKGAVEIDIDHDDSEYSFAEYRSSTYRAHINISIGCDKSCTYCIVPNTRGDEISIPPQIIINEIKKSVSNGAVEVFLLGQNVNNYGKRFSARDDKSYNFTKLLQEISKIDGLHRIRFTSPHPLHMDDEFIEEFASNPKICKSIHIPLQSGSTKVLKDMKRGYTKEWFLDRVSRIKSLCPTVRISTDIIVGFPDESDDEFADTIDVMRKVEFDQIFNFKYSARPQTEAQNFQNQIDERTASHRLNQVIELHKEQLNASSLKYIDQEMEVFFEELSFNSNVSGFSDNYLRVNVKVDDNSKYSSDELLGTFRKVKITNAHRTSLDGIVIED
jgi:tRNA-2-methylthio-N6-dimethylallyladenosine synthase